MVMFMSECVSALVRIWLNVLARNVFILGTCVLCQGRSPSVEYICSECCSHSESGFLRVVRRQARDSCVSCWTGSMPSLA